MHRRGNLRINSSVGKVGSEVKARRSRNEIYSVCARARLVAMDGKKKKRYKRFSSFRLIWTHHEKRESVYSSSFWTLEARHCGRDVPSAVLPASRIRIQRRAMASTVTSRFAFSLKKTSRFASRTN